MLRLAYSVGNVANKRKNTVERTISYRIHLFS